MNLFDVFRKMFKNKIKPIYFIYLLMLISFHSFNALSSIEFFRSSVCYRPEGCLSLQTFKKYQRIILSNDGYLNKMCRCSSQLSYQCGHVYCTANQITCIKYLNIISKSNSGSNEIKRCEQ
jgi:hypothetical protein